MDQGASMSFDLHLSSHNINEPKYDHIDRVKQQIKILQNQNYELHAQLKYIKSHPHQIIKEHQAKLLKKIAQLRQQNQGIQQLIEKSKIPGFAEMTKKKTSFTAQTPGKNSKRQQDQWSQYQKRNQFQSIQMQEKFQLSTCQNFPIQSIIQNNPLRPLEPLQNYQLQARAQLTIQLLNLIDRTSQINNQIHTITSNQPPQVHNSLRLLAGNNRRFQQISKYKIKLMQLLKKLKIRQASQENIARQYQILYDQTLQKFREATSLLNQLSTINNTQNLDDIYAQVLQLQERLKYINEQLQKIDENQWLRDILNELILALKRIGISVAPEVKNLNSQSTNQALKEKIDHLAEILIECALSHRADQKQKLVLLKMYHQQQKQNNKKIIKNLQNKEQALSKKLIDLQMNN